MPVHWAPPYGSIQRVTHTHNLLSNPLTPDRPARSARHTHMSSNCRSRVPHACHVHVPRPGSTRCPALGCRSWAQGRRGVVQLWRLRVSQLVQARRRS
eukprot:5407670-Prymnesium_polylepis.1